MNVPLREWLAQEPTRQEVRNRFVRGTLRLSFSLLHLLHPSRLSRLPQELFLKSHPDNDGHPVYMRKIEEMMARNSQSLEVSYLHLSQGVPLLAVWVADMPREMLELMNQVARKVALERFPARPDDRADEEAKSRLEVFVRITHLPIADSLRELRHVRGDGRG